VRRGIDLKTVAELLGHASTRMTEHYVHVAGDVGHLLDAANKVTNPPNPPQNPDRKEGS
jgi:site-specific recombinase XerD